MTFATVDLVVMLWAVMAATTYACIGDIIGLSKVKLNRTIFLDVPIDNGVVTFKWDCNFKAILRYELVIEMLRMIDPAEDDDGHGHSRGNLPRGTLWRRFVDRSEHVQRSRYIIVKSISPNACEYRTEELQTNSVYSVYLMAVNNNEEPFACSNNHTFHTSARVIQHMVITTEVMLSMGLVFMLWLCAVGAFLRQWKFVQLSTPYEATRYYKPQNVDQIRIINREEDGIIYRHSVVNTARRTTSVGCASLSEHSTVRIDDACKISGLLSAECADKQSKASKSGERALKANCNRVPKKERSMPCVSVMGQLEPLIDATQSSTATAGTMGGQHQGQSKNACSKDAARPSQQLTVLVSTDMLSKTKSAPNIFITDLCSSA